MPDSPWAKGPWVINDLAGPTEISTVDPFEDIGCAYSSGPNDERALANANLIAAAPDLYEALERCASRMRGHPMWDSDVAGPSQTLIAAEAALSKARGETP